MQRRVDPRRGCWHRACAFLTRMALEDAVTQHVTRRYPTAATARMSSKLHCLRTVIPEPAALDAVSAWNELSRACHLHPYELAPTVTELRRWAEAVARVLPHDGGTAGMANRQPGAGATS